MEINCPFSILIKNLYGIQKYLLTSGFKKIFIF